GFWAWPSCWAASQWACSPRCGGCDSAFIARSRTLHRSRTFCVPYRGCEAFAVLAVLSQTFKTAMARPSHSATRGTRTEQCHAFRGDQLRQEIRSLLGAMAAEGRCRVERLSVQDRA